MTLAALLFLQAGTIDLLRDPNFQTFSTSWYHYGTTATVTTGAVASDPVARILNLPIQSTGTSNPWDIGLGQAATTVTVPQARILVFEGYFRGTGVPKLDVYAEHPTTYVKRASASFGLSDEWRLYRMSAQVPDAIPAGDIRLVFHLAHGNGTVRMSKPRFFVAEPGATIANYPPLLGNDYQGARDDSWRAAALTRIEKRRKAPLTIVAETTKGLPASDATIQIRQVDSPFRWGTAVQGPTLMNDSANRTPYRDALKARFDTAVFEWEHKWHASDWMPDRIARAEAAMTWMRANGINRFRAHTLMWGDDPFMPANFGTQTIAQQRSAIAGHVAPEMNAVGDGVYIWDAVNEAVTAQTVWNRVGWDLYPEVFRIARSTKPAMRLSYNENVLHFRPDAAMAKIRELIDNGAPFEVVGDQAHFEAPFIPIPRILARWDAVAALGKKIEITECDVSTWNDALQTEYVGDLALAAFSHPAVESFLFWGFWEGAHWKAADGGHLINRNWTPRPAMVAFDRLIKTTLRTNVDARSRWSGRAFLGRYEVTVTRRGVTRVVPVTVSGTTRVTVRV